MYSTFQYFLKAYCTLSIYEEEMIDLMQQFKEQEEQETKKKLLHEFVQMQKIEDWKKACQEAERYGNRTWTIEETKAHISNFVSILQNKKA
ncbi:hypothetical protein BACCIP111899_02231 [Bacillus rhizoplanae]|uniref:Uncharacterized protein n=1 Tax=Bacillus rhizoplanae TaxID=2880966 RepID=A0ABN8A1R4_9BACI|nr:hypothetical protein [Bacillus rhizoplanae]CAG9613036.1 hypothetical protein BACCIP111899_02231 [Bacillus rhizoplanae]